MSYSTVSRRTKTPIWYLCIATVVLLLAMNVWLLMPQENVRSQNPRPLPAGQFQADARTLVAAFTYLFNHEVESGAAEMPAGSAVLCASNLNVQSLTPASFSCLSNPSELLSGLLTNVPVRS